MPAILPPIKIESNSMLTRFFLPYQIHWIQAEDSFHSQKKRVIALAEKSVRIGWTFADAFKNVRKRLRLSKRDYLFATKDYPSALEYMRLCYGFADLLDFTRAILSHGEDYLQVPRVDANGRLTGFTDQIKVGLIKFDNGSRIIAFSSNPRAMAVHAGDVGLDEFAKHPNARLLWETAQGRVTWGYDIAVWSSHDGEDTLFNEFVLEARAALGSPRPLGIGEGPGMSATPDSPRPFGMGEGSRVRATPSVPPSNLGDGKEAKEIPDPEPPAPVEVVDASVADPIPASELPAAMRAYWAQFLPPDPIAEPPVNPPPPTPDSADPGSPRPSTMGEGSGVWAVPDSPRPLGVGEGLGVRATPNSPWNLYYRVTLTDAIELGLLNVINRVQKTQFTPDLFVDDCRARARQEEIFQQTYMCNPLGAAANHIVDWSVIERCRYDYDIIRLHLEQAEIVQRFGAFTPYDQSSREENIREFIRHHFKGLLGKHKTHRLGFDVAASGQGDLSCIYIDQADGDDLWLRALFTCRTEDWHFLSQVLHWFMRELRSVKACGDETGLGKQICWEAAQQFSWHFFPVNFSSRKHDLGFALMNQLSTSQKRFPKSHQDIAADFFALRKSFVGTKWVFSEGQNSANPNSHCDIAWAAGLATEAHLAHRCDAGAMVG